MSLKATNNYVFILKEENITKKNGLILPSSGLIKPHKGKIFSVGGKVTDPDIKRGEGKTALFHQGIGFSFEEAGVEYLVLQEHEIIAIN